MTRAEKIVEALLEDEAQLQAAIRSQKPPSTDTWPGGFTAHYPAGDLELVGELYVEPEAWGPARYYRHQGGGMLWKCKEIWKGKAREVHHAASREQAQDTLAKLAEYHTAKGARVIPKPPLTPTQ